jgi:hypothetical protein
LHGDRAERPRRRHAGVRRPRHENVRLQLRRHAAVGDHRPVSVLFDERHDDAVAPRRPRAEHVDRAPEKVILDELPGGVRAALPDEPRLGSERRRPRGDVGSLPAGADARLRAGVVALGERPRELDDDVEEQVAESTNHHV